MKAVLIEQSLICSWIPQPLSSFKKLSKIIDCILCM